jgi:DNA-binding NarL/FixJ family response regulator
MAENKKRVWCTSKQKMDALDLLDKGESLQRIAKDLDVGISTIKD